MPSLTTSIEDNSPLITYSSDWTTGSSGTDASISSYSSSNFFATTVQGGSMTFTFNGTGVQLFGARRGNHGLYQVTVDGVQTAATSGAASPDLFQQTLFSTSNLNQDLHTVVLTNLEAKFVDIDFITWQTNIGTDSEQLITNTIQDNDPSFVYSPSSAWTTSPQNIGTFSGGNGHQTGTNGASFTYTFQGDGVSLYGPVGPDFATYTVQVDGGVTTQFTANKAFFAPQTLLFHANGLGKGSHTVKLSFNSVQSGQVFAVDYATVFTTPSLGGSALTAATTQQTNSVPIGLIVGIVIGSVAVLSLTVLAVIYLFNQRKRLELEIAQQQSMSQKGYDQPPLQPAPVTRRHSSFGNFNLSAMSPPSRVVITNPDPSPTRYTNQQYSSDPSQSSNEIEEQSRSSSAHLLSSSSSSASSSNYPRRNASLYAQKGKSGPLPASVGQNLDGVPEEVLRRNRLRVVNRPQDFGSVNPSDFDPSDPSVPTTGLETNPPPDYVQATERYSRSIAK